MNYSVLVAHSSYHGDKPLTYASDDRLKEGQVISVPLKQKRVTGIVVKEIEHSVAFKVSHIHESFPYYIPNQLLSLADWLSDYYPSALGVRSELFVPTGKFIDYSPEKPKISFDQYNLPKLRTEQIKALEVIKGHGKQNILLHGDTGTGKTRIYIELALDSLKNGKSVLVLGPEIGLTEQLKSSFESVIGPDRVILLHSNLSAKKRQLAWQTIAQSSDPLVVVGARSALFAPIKQLGVVIVDEAHDTAYKQEQQPYYQATRVAARLASLHNCQAIFGSATPLLNDYYAFTSKNLPIVRLTKPAIRRESKITRHIIDHSDNAQFDRSKTISTKLIATIQNAINNKEQSLLFLNRRGSARAVKCTNCGWQALCPKCDIAMVYHADRHQLLCHSCGLITETPKKCPECQALDIIFSVPGTKAIESELERIFPSANISRFDRDTAASQKVERLYKDITSGKIDILVGTQGLVKGFDLPKLSVVGVLQADSSLQIADYTAAERTYQLISQVSGRLGRGHRDGQLFIQTYMPNNMLIDWAVNKNYNVFYQHELKHRQTFMFPPLCYLLKISIKRASAKSAQDALSKLRLEIKSTGLQISHPTPAYPERTGGKYRWQIVIKSKQRSQLTKIVKKYHSQFTCDLDPNTLL